MTSISLCMIVKDEEEHLEACLSSVKGFSDEIIIIDTGSKDKTKEIAKKFTDKIFDFKWKDDFAQARNFSISKATKEWIFVLDADEVMSKSDLETLRLLLEDTDSDAFSLIQRNYTDDSKQKNWVKIEDKQRQTECKSYSGFIRNPNIRLFKSKKNISFNGVIHEIVDNSIKEQNLKLSRLEIPIHHYHEEKNKNSLKERQLYYLKVFEKNIKEKPSGKLYYDAASVHFHFTKDYKKAIQYLENAINLGFSKNMCKEGLAQCYAKLKEYEKAYLIYSELAKSGYLTPSLCNNLANILMMHKHYRPALKFLKLALAKGNQDRERIENNIKTIEKILQK